MAYRKRKAPVARRKSAPRRTANKSRSPRASTQTVRIVLQTAPQQPQMDMFTGLPQIAAAKKKQPISG